MDRGHTAPTQGTRRGDTYSSTSLFSLENVPPWIHLILFLRRTLSEEEEESVDAAEPRAPSAASPGTQGALLGAHPWGAPSLTEPSRIYPPGDIEPLHTGTPRERPGHYQGEFFSSGSPRKAA